MNEIIQAVKQLLNTPKSKFIFAIITSFFFIVLAAAPVFLIPGNDILFQIRIYAARDWILLAVLAPLSAILMYLQFVVFKQANSVKDRTKSLGSVGAGGYSTVVAGLLATASCTSCVAGLFGFLGIGGVLFIAQYRWLFVLGAILVVLIALYFAARSYNNHCKTCKI